MDDCEIIGVRKPISQTSVRQRPYSLNQDEQQDLWNIKDYGKEILWERTEAHAALDYAMVKSVQANRLGNQAAEDEPQE